MMFTTLAFNPNRFSQIPPNKLTAFHRAHNYCEIPSPHATPKCFIEFNRNSRHSEMKRIHKDTPITGPQAKGKNHQPRKAKFLALRGPFVIFAGGGGPSAKFTQTAPAPRLGNPKICFCSGRPGAPRLIRSKGI